MFWRIRRRGVIGIDGFFLVDVEIAFSRGLL
jgi:hypothetical protein